MEKINKLLLVLIVVLLPFVILMTGVRLLLTPAWAGFEYARPGFPKDPYGFTLVERKELSSESIRYLTSSVGDDHLAGVKLQSGQRAFDNNELSHMLDVRKLVQTVLIFWYALSGFLLALVVWFVVMRQWSDLRMAFRWGSGLSFALLALMLIGVLGFFNRLFNAFHGLFFEQGTWTFSASSTLIRLFPLEFWRDSFGLVAILTMLVSGLILLLTHERKVKAPAVSQELNG